MKREKTSQAEINRGSRQISSGYLGMHGVKRLITHASWMFLPLVIASMFIDSPVLIVLSAIAFAFAIADTAIDIYENWGGENNPSIIESLKITAIPLIVGCLIGFGYLIWQS